MQEKLLIIKNKYGLHARPAAKFVEIASRYSADVTLIKDGVDVNGKSIMGVLMLAAEKGDEITLKTNGKDEVELAQVLVDFLATDMDEG